MLMCIPASSALNRPYEASASDSSSTMNDELGELIGNGWRGAVSFGIFDGKAVAVKAVCFHKEVSPTPDLPSHRHVVNVIALQEAAGQLLEMRELCAGGEFFDLIAERGPLEESDVLEILLQLCDALVHCHSHSLVNGQLRPEHVLLDDEEQVKLTGWRRNSSSSPTARLPLRPLQALDAPELQGRHELSATFAELAAADMWSLGVLASVMLLGYPAEELAMSVRGQGSGLEGLPSLAATTEPFLRRALGALLSPIPADRPTAAALASMLSSQSASQLASHSPTHSPTQAASHAASHPLLPPLSD
eukprot:1108927-Pleurochrysis_carterae.AAC.1